MKCYLQVAAMAMLLFVCTVLKSQDQKSVFQSTQWTNSSSQIAKSVYKSIENDEVFFKQRPFQITEKLIQENHVLKQSIHATLESKILNEIYTNAPENVELEIPNETGEWIRVLLVKADIVADGFRVVSSSSRNKNLNISDGIHYRGIIENESASIVALSVFKDEMMGMVSTENNGRIVIHPSVNSKSDYIIYKDSDLKYKPNIGCDIDKIHDHPSSEVNPYQAESLGDCVKVYLECDHALFLNKGSVSNTVNYISAVFNNIAALYANEDVTIKISEIFVWDTPDAYSITNSVNALYQFRSTRQSFNGDIAHLAALGGQNIGGVAWLNGLCSSYKYAYSNIHSSYQNVPIYSWTVEVMAHEIGHNLGSNHTQWCGWPGGPIDNCYTPEGGCSPGPAPIDGGTIMSYCHLTPNGINFTKGFGPYPGNAIRNKILNSTCLSSCDTGGNGGTGGGEPSCGTPSNLSASNISQTGAILSWNGVVGGTSYRLEYKAKTAQSWSYVTTTTQSYALSNLFANMVYQFRVQSTCSTTSGTFSPITEFATEMSNSYCESKSVSSVGEWINYFKVGNLERISESDNGYFDGSNLTGAAINKGKVIQVYFGSGQVGLAKRMYWRIWIDYNQNGNFADPGELLISGYSTSTARLYANILVSSTAKLGKTKIRVAMKYGGLPNNCEVFARGEVEDYSVDILESQATYEGNENNDKIQSLSLTPNPANEQIQLNYQSDRDADGNYKIYNQSGQIIHQSLLKVSKGINFSTIDVSQISSGVYIFEMSIDGNKNRKKFIKL